MKIKGYLLSMFILFIILLSVSFCTCCSTVSATEGFMDIDEIKPGMKGYGKTVFQGGDIDLFHVEVLGVLKKWEAGLDLILIRMSGGPLEKSGIIAGMSGSPVYIDNRIIGAVAYGWSFAKEAIAGVTPIKEMMNTLLNIPQEKDDLSLNSIPWELHSFPGGNSPADPQSIASRAHQEKELHAEFGELQLTPIQAPLIISGFDRKVFQDKHAMFNAYGLYPVYGGGHFPTDETSNNTAIVPGSSIAAVLIKGDLNAAVVGTVTYTDGDKVLAFGHPFLQTGRSDIPVASAYVYAVLPSHSQSVKMASPVKIVGRIYQDRKPGIAATLGEYARMIPCHIEVKGVKDITYDFEVISHKFLTPSLILMAAQSAVLSTELKAGEKTVNIRLSARIQGYENPVTIENVFYELDQSWFSLNHIIQSLAMIMNNQFQPVHLNQVDLKITLLDDRKTAHIEGIRVSKKLVRPGEPLEVDVLLKPFSENSFSKKITVNIPEDILPGSTLQITACDARYGHALDGSRAAGKHLPVNFEQLLQHIQDRERNNRLIIRISLPKKGLTYKGEGLPSLPSSVFSIMTLSNHSGIGPLFDEVISSIPMEYIITGNQRITVQVE